MLFPTPTSALLFATAILAPVFAAPLAPLAADTSAASPLNQRAEQSAQTNDCGASTFVNQSSGGSPKVADCQQLAYNIRGSGSWYFPLNTYKTIATYGTCAFGAAFGLSGAIGGNYIGNEDVIDLINDSINRFQWFGLVGAKGHMDCDHGSADWSIYHT